jgi:hypothetical protein
VIRAHARRRDLHDACRARSGTLRGPRPQGGAAVRKVLFALLLAGLVALRCCPGERQMTRAFQRSAPSRDGGLLEHASGQGATSPISSAS